MTVLFVIGLIITLCVVVFNLTLIIRWAFYFKSYPILNEEQPPFVSILVAVRNEASNINRCLDSLLAIDYPKDRFEILIGDDDSEDNSLSMLREYEKQNDLISVFSIRETLGNALGKANVLAHLAREAKGEYFLVTDADIQLPETWIKGMLGGIGDNTGMVIGFTQVEDNAMQNVDWLFALGMIKVIADASTPVTGMGNNMLVPKEAYWSVGGYENIPFSVTEDFELFKQISAEGYGTIHIASKEVLTRSTPMKGFGKLLVQRKRWMTGAVQLPWSVLLLLLLNALYFPAIILLLILSPFVGIGVLFLKLIFQSLFISYVARKLDITVRWWNLILFEGYSMVLTVSTSLYFLLPIRVKWKGRKY